MQEVSEEVPVSGVHHILGSLGTAKQEKYQYFRSWFGL
jgi:hypothetical protein